MLRMPAHEIFGGCFGLSVHGEGARRILFDVISFAPVENEVGRKKDKWDVAREIEEVARHFDVRFFSEVWI